MTNKTIIINADNFSTLDGFYDEIDNVLTKNLTWKTGRNFNALRDLLVGGFGVHDYEEPINLIWKNSDKSKKDLTKIIDGDPLYKILTDIIKELEHIKFSEK